MSSSTDHSPGACRTPRGARTWLALGCITAALGVLALAACGQSMEVQLPELATKSAMPSGARPPLSAADQKRAIDELIAKRDSQTQSQAK